MTTRTWLRYQFHMDSGKIIEYDMNVVEGALITQDDISETVDEMRQFDNFRYAQDGSGFLVNLKKCEGIVVTVVDGYGQTVRAKGR